MTGWTAIQRITHPVLFRGLVIAAVFALGMRAGAQEKAGVEAEGYVTAVHAPDSFDVNETHVVISATTTFGQAGSKEIRSRGELKDEIQVGAFVRVGGPKTGDTVDARMVEIRDRSEKRLDGFGVIDKVITAGTNPVYEADGYQIRIESSTTTSFSDGLKTLSNVGAGTWVKYEGKRDHAGVVVAAKAAFVSALQGRIKATSLQDTAADKAGLIDSNGSFLPPHAKARLSDSGRCGWHKVPADPELQQRVWRIGMRVVPAYQKQLAADDAAKIRFRFHVVDEPKVRSELVCQEGLILVPKQVVERLKDDDQLAAVLADGTAMSLQSQAVRVTVSKALLKGAEVAADVMVVADPLDFVVVNGLVVPAAMHPIEVRLEKQRGRMALALMKDAGYDPWQAPEAWRLLAPKELPKDPDSLKYPNRSGYQLSILNLQYKRAATDSQAAPAESAPSENR